MANQKIIMAVFALLLSLSPAFVRADAYSPTVQFEMSVEKLVYFGQPSVNMRINSFHESSSEWVMLINASVDDVAPYDRFQVSVQCDDSPPAVFDTSDYQVWNDSGYVSILFPFGNPAYPTTYNSISLTAKSSVCDISLSNYTDSFDGNPSYDFVTVEIVPFLQSIEFVNCSSVDTSELGLLNEASGFVSIMTGVWQILWYAYSIFIVVFAIFIIPLGVFILIRWAMFRITGYKLVENTEEYR